MSESPSMPQSPESPTSWSEEEARGTNDTSVLGFVPEPQPEEQEEAERMAYDLNIEALRGQFYELTLSQKRFVAHIIRHLLAEFGMSFFGDVQEHD
ncbi:hypothetical protein VNI00_014002 [Paramarasmius palmivorus]|uniref:Uncharacterized protein n=1 Tax=Paramarasmius palmivorus TaxID=297713 RepID=A0AAW0BXX9_9AGAR